MTLLTPCPFSGIHSKSKQKRGCISYTFATVSEHCAHLGLSTVSLCMPLGTILPAAPGAASGSAGPTRGPKASRAPAAATRSRHQVRLPWFPGRKKRHGQRRLDLRHLASDGGAAGTRLLSRWRRRPRFLAGSRGGLAREYVGCVRASVECGTFFCVFCVRLVCSQSDCAEYA